MEGETTVGSRSGRRRAAGGCVGDAWHGAPAASCRSSSRLQANFPSASPTLSRRLAAALLMRSQLASRWSLHRCSLCRPRPFSSSSQLAADQWPLGPTEQDGHRSFSHYAGRQGRCRCHRCWIPSSMLRGGGGSSPRRGRIPPALPRSKRGCIATPTVQHPPARMLVPVLSRRSQLMPLHRLCAFAASWGPPCPPTSSLRSATGSIPRRRGPGWSPVDLTASLNKNQGAPFRCVGRHALLAYLSRQSHRKGINMVPYGKLVPGPGS